MILNKIISFYDNRLPSRKIDFFYNEDDLLEKLFCPNNGKTINSPLLGDYNVYNLLSDIVVLESMGIKNINDSIGFVPKDVIKLVH